MDRPDTYTLLNFISYLCVFGFKILFDLRFCVLTTHKNALSLIHINELIKITMEKCVGDVQLINMPTFTDGKGQEEANSSDLNDRAKGFVIINAFFLMEAFSKKTGFVLGRYTIRGRLNFANPFAANDRSIGRSGDELPCLIEQECSEFTVHGGHPFQILGGGVESGRRRRKRGRGVKA